LYCFTADENPWLIGFAKDGDSLITREFDMKNENENENDKSFSQQNMNQRLVNFADEIRSNMMLELLDSDLDREVAVHEFERNVLAAKEGRLNSDFLRQKSSPQLCIALGHWNLWSVVCAPERWKSKIFF
jgi:hypothetical protein